MSSQRLRKNNSPASSKLQPLKATVPLASLIRNTSPTRKKQSPVSSPVQTLENRKKRRSPDVFFPEHRTLVSPLGDKHKSLKLNLNIRRTNSLETLSTNYVNGQWPKDVASTHTHSFANAGTQTISFDENQDELLSQHKRSASLGSGDKEKFRQYLQRTKHSQPIHGRQSPVQVDHAAANIIHHFSSSSSHAQSRAIPIPVNTSSASSNVQSLHIRRSVEGLNTEIEKLVLGSDLPEPSNVFEKTPEGHRGPLASLLSKNMQTQTDNGYIDPIELLTSIPVSGVDSRSQSTSPTWINGVPPNTESTTTTRCSSGDSPDGSLQFLKFSSSPKPNNSFLFARGPPDGAEKIPLYVEHREDSQESGEVFCCPDKSKVKILFSQNSPFYPLPSVPKMTVNLPSSNMASSQMT